jgi:hypothetical protein
MNLPDIPVDVLIGIGLALALAGLGWLTLRVWRRYRERRALLKRIAAVSVDHLRDVALPDGSDGWFHVDFLLLSPAGIVVIDLRDVPGLIFGGEQMTEWTVMQTTQRFTFANPLGALYDRVAIVRQIAGEGVPVEGRVVFTDRGSFPKGHPRQVTRLGSLATDLPPLAGGAAAAEVERLRPAWERVRAAATPSPLRSR